MMDMHGGMGWMMAGMMGLGLLGWALVIGLLAAIVVLLWRLVSRMERDRSRDRQPSDPRTSANP